MTSDSGLFHTRPGPGLVPLYEAKMMHQFDHRWATYTGGDENAVREVTEAEKADPEFEVRPRYWVEQEEVERRLEAKGWTQPWLLGWRDITKAVNERTVIASVLPRVGVGHNMPLLFPSPNGQDTDGPILLAILNSLVFDYCARIKVGGTHLTYFILKQMPLIAPSAITMEQRQFLIRRVALLTSRSQLMAGWATTLQHNVAPANQATRQLALAELNAMVAHLYGVSRHEVEFMLDPEAVMGPDYPTQTFRILRQKEMAAYGEFRTKRLVLEAWDRHFGSA
jgi:hypothetical protein